MVQICCIKYGHPILFWVLKIFNSLNLLNFTFYVENERKSYFHRAPSHNKFIRIYPDGKVLFSMRLTVTAACPMNFRYFPMDHQACDLEIESCMLFFF